MLLALVLRAGASCGAVVAVRAPVETVCPSAASTGVASRRVAPILLLGRPVASASGAWSMDQHFLRRKTTSWSAAESRLPPAPGPAPGRLPGRKVGGCSVHQAW
ncbi:hypothetical protein BG418_01040 [Streptomyces sp. CBMA152]|nr:hypothetical protein [Streptomyces sp. CBMA152]